MVRTSHNCAELPLRRLALHAPAARPLEVRRLANDCRCGGSWQAWQNPLEPPTLHVEGTCICPGLGFSAKLRRAAFRSPSNSVVVLELVATPPTENAAAIAEELPVYYAEENRAIVTEVVITTCDITVPVAQIS